MNKYFDVCSLYPYICKYGKFPVGHPNNIIGHEECFKEDLLEINGLKKCSVLPPVDLCHPVLHLKQNNILMFSLAISCTDENVWNFTVSKWRIAREDNHPKVTHIF